MASCKHVLMRIFLLMFQNYRYFALQYGYRCTCANENLSADKPLAQPHLLTGYCYAPCTGNKYENCGGRNFGIRIFDKEGKYLLSLHVEYCVILRKVILTPPILHAKQVVDWIMHFTNPCVQNHSLIFVAPFVSAVF